MCYLSAMKGRRFLKTAVLPSAMKPMKPPTEARGAANFNDSLKSDLTAGAVLHPISSAAANLGCSFQPSPDIVVSIEARAASPNNTDVGEEDLGGALQKWAVKHSIKRDALSDLLKLLKPHHSCLPSDARTLLRTPRGPCLECSCAWALCSLRTSKRVAARIEWLSPTSANFASRVQY